MLSYQLTGHDRRGPTADGITGGWPPADGCQRLK